MSLREHFSDCMCPKCMCKKKVLASGGMGTVLISAVLEGWTVESLWERPQQLQWLFAGYWTELSPPPCYPCFLPCFPPSSPVLVQVSGIAKEALCGTHPDSPSWQRPLCWEMHERVAGKLAAWQVVPLGNHSVRADCSQFPVSGQWSHKGRSWGV